MAALPFSFYELTFHRYHTQDVIEIWFPAWILYTFEFHKKHANTATANSGPLIYDFITNHLKTMMKNGCTLLCSPFCGVDIQVGLTCATLSWKLQLE